MFRVCSSQSHRESKGSVLKPENRVEIEKTEKIKPRG